MANFQPYQFGQRPNRPIGSPVNSIDPAAQREIDAMKAATRSPLTDMLPVFRSVRGYFHQITVPSGLTIATGHCGWFLIRSVRCPRDIAADSMLAGFQADLRSADVVGAGVNGQISAAGGAGTALPWGDRTGCGAAIVIGYDLNLALQTWTSRPAPDVPGIDIITGAAPNANTLLPQQNSAADFPIVLTFPPGAWSDTTPGASQPRMMFMPSQRPLIQGHSLDIALVVSRTTVASLAASRVICGRGDVSLMLLETESLARQA